MSHRAIQQKGVTLIELMIALALGLLLSAAALMMFVSNKESSRLQTEFSGIQEKARFALDYMMREVRIAGFQGGTGIDLVNVLNDNTSGPSFEFDKAVMGYDAKTDGSGITNCDPNVDSTCDTAQLAALQGIMPDAQAGSDILSLVTVSESNCRVTAHNGAYKDPSDAKDACCSNIRCEGPVSADMKIEGRCNIEDGDILLVYNSKSAAIFQAVNVNAQGNLVFNTGNSVTPGNCTKLLGDRYSPDGSLMSIQRAHYYVGDDNGMPALKRIKNNGSAETLVRGIENMQILYGVGDDATVDEYRVASAVADWDKVYAIRLHLLVRSDNESILDSQQTYLFDFNGDNVAEQVTGDPLSSDSNLALRKVFTTTIGIRNRLP